jgi:hypothetical protein
LLTQVTKLPEKSVGWDTARLALQALVAQRVKPGSDVPAATP